MTVWPRSRNHFASRSPREPASSTGPFVSKSSRKEWLSITVKSGILVGLHNRVPIPKSEAFHPELVHHQAEARFIRTVPLHARVQRVDRAIRIGSLNGAHHTVYLCRPVVRSSKEVRGLGELSPPVEEPPGRAVLHVKPDQTSPGQPHAHGLLPIHLEVLKHLVTDPGPEDISPKQDRAAILLDVLPERVDRGDGAAPGIQPHHVPVSLSDRLVDGEPLKSVVMHAMRDRPGGP